MPTRHKTRTLPDQDQTTEATLVQHPSADVAVNYCRQAPPEHASGPTRMNLVGPLDFHSCSGSGGGCNTTIVIGGLLQREGQCWQTFRVAPFPSFLFTGSPNSNIFVIKL